MKARNDLKSSKIVVDYLSQSHSRYNIGTDHRVRPVYCFPIHICYSTLQNESERAFFSLVCTAKWGIVLFSTCIQSTVTISLFLLFIRWIGRLLSEMLMCVLGMNASNGETKRGCSTCAITIFSLFTAASNNTIPLITFTLVWTLSNTDRQTSLRYHYVYTLLPLLLLTSN